MIHRFVVTKRQLCWGLACHFEFWGWNAFDQTVLERGGVARQFESIRSAPTRIPNVRAVWTDLVVLFSVVAGVIIVLFRNDLLPARFFYDGLFIQALAQGLAPTQNDVAYGNVGLVYRALGLQDEANAASLVGFGIFVAILIFLRVKFAPASPSIMTWLFLSTSILLGAVYIGYYSKDAILLPFVFAVAACGRKRKFEVLIISSMLLYAGLFRSYWFIIAGLYFGFRLFAKFFSTRKRLLSAAIAASVLVGLAVSLSLGTTPDHFRVSVNESRAGSEDAGSMIHPFIPSSSLPAGLINVALTLVSLVFPLPLALSGGLYYAVLALYIGALWWMFYRSVPRIVAGRTNDSSARNTFAARTLALVTAVLITQSIFEPDYGSALRHITPLMPLIMCTIWSDQKSSRKAQTNETRGGTLRPSTSRVMRS